ncbi:hypothetical protein GCM10028801_37580 [Nocardioides maradonensis]
MIQLGIGQVDPGEVGQVAHLVAGEFGHGANPRQRATGDDHRSETLDLHDVTHLASPQTYTV